jgi:hypothetical protein
VAVNSKDLGVYIDLITYQLEFGDPISAISTADLAANQFADSEIIYQLSAKANLMADILENALVSIDRAIALNPQNGKNHLHKGEIQWKAGAKLGACKSWSKSGELGCVEAYHLIQSHCKRKETLI